MCFYRERSVWCGVRYVVWDVWCVGCVVCGVWCVVCGVWCVVWYVVYGVRCVGYGVWCVVCGVWCVGHFHFEVIWLSWVNDRMIDCTTHAHAHAFEHAHAHAHAYARDEWDEWDGRERETAGLLLFWERETVGLLIFFSFDLPARSEYSFVHFRNVREYQFFASIRLEALRTLMKKGRVRLNQQQQKDNNIYDWWKIGAVCLLSCLIRRVWYIRGAVFILFALPWRKWRKTSTVLFLLSLTISW